MDTITERNTSIEKFTNLEIKRVKNGFILFCNGDRSLAIVGDTYVFNSAEDLANKIIELDND